MSTVVCAYKFVEKMMKPRVGIVGTGIYLPKQTMSAKEISERTKGVWTEEAVIAKLGIKQIYLPGEDDGTQEMGAKAALDCLENTKVDPKDIDVILCMGEEWKEYPLTTSALYIQDRIGAVNAWGIDVQNRCCTTVSALKMAQDMLIADDEINTIMVVGGYRNGDFVDFTDKNMSMMYNLSAGAGAVILQKNYGKNLLLGSHIIADGSLSRTAGVEIGGICHPITPDNYLEARKSLRLMDPVKMKDRLNEVSMPNWYKCIDESLRKAHLERKDITYLDILHIKRSGHKAMLADLNLTEEQTIYLEDYGHLGQVDQILSLHLALKSGQVKDGSVICMLAAGIGYVWAANIIKWG
ncbi:MAG TPA: 3-oxoacyl-ACP synthase [Bacilli bacterium]|nr:3-oxoacyl-ACP synthase [Bacilli bacterium]